MVSTEKKTRSNLIVMANNANKTRSNLIVMVNTEKITRSNLDCYGQHCQTSTDSCQTYEYRHRFGEGSPYGNKWARYDHALTASRYGQHHRRITRSSYGLLWPAQRRAASHSGCLTLWPAPQDRVAYSNMWRTLITASCYRKHRKTAAWSNCLLLWAVCIVPQDSCKRYD